MTATHFRCILFLKNKKAAPAPPDTASSVIIACKAHNHQHHVDYTTSAGCLTMLERGVFYEKSRIVYPRVHG